MIFRKVLAGLAALVLCAGPALAQVPPASIPNSAGVAVPVQPVYCISSTCGGGSGGGFPADAPTTGSIASGTANAAFTVNLANGEATTAFKVSGLTASAATLTLEGSNDGGTTWSAINEIISGSTAQSTMTADGQIRVNTAGRTNVRLRVSTTGSGAIAVAANASTASGMVTVATSLPPGANPLGYVGGFDFFVSDMPTVQNASYASGNCMGGFQAVAVARISGGSGILNKLTLISKGAGTTALQVYVFAAAPSSSTCTDKSTFTIAAADLSKLIGTFSLTPAVPTGGAASEAEQSSMAMHFITSGNANLYIAIVSGGTWTPGTTSDLIINLGGIQD